MEVDGRCVLVLGGAGLVGRAVCRRVLERRPSRLVVASLTRREAEEAARELGKEASGRPSVVEPSWGDLFVPAELGDRSRAEVLAGRPAACWSTTCTRSSPPTRWTATHSDVSSWTSVPTV